MPLRQALDCSVHPPSGFEKAKKIFVSFALWAFDSVSTNTIKSSYYDQSSFSVKYHCLHKINLYISSICLGAMFGLVVRTASLNIDNPHRSTRQARHPSSPKHLLLSHEHFFTERFSYLKKQNPDLVDNLASIKVETMLPNLIKHPPCLETDNRFPGWGLWQSYKCKPDCRRETVLPWGGSRKWQVRVDEIGSLRIKADWQHTQGEGPPLRTDIS